MTVNLQLSVIFSVLLQVCIVYGSVVRMMQQDFLRPKQKEINSDNIPDFTNFFPDYTKFPKVKARTSNGSFAFASYYGDHMVLQRAPQRAGLWGYANKGLVGKEVTVTVQLEEGQNSDVTTATIRQSPENENEAVWSVQLKATAAGGPYNVKATVDAHTLMLKDVYFGEVWLCSGQSNMQFTVPQTFDAADEEIMADNLPLVRLFTAGMNTADTPLYDLATVEEPWSVASAKSVGYRASGYFSAVCWTYGRYLQQFLGVPVGMLSTTWGGTPVEAWSSPDALKKCGLQDKGVGGPGNKSVLYNAMIHPFLNLTIKGAIWYQGEQNTHAPDNYNCTFPAMIADWRTKWAEGTQKQTKDDFPFGFVQLGPSSVYEKGKIVTRGYPDIRWHQTADVGYVPNDRMPNTFMAAAIDLTDDKSPWGGVHIRDKLTVGQRLALSGLSLVYGAQGLRYQGPQVTAYFIDIGFYTLRLEFDSGKQPISVQHEKEGFDVCCQRDNQTFCTMDAAGPNWHPAPIIAHDSTGVTISWSPCAGQWIMGVRYIWRETPCTYKACPVYSMENALPALPFIVNGLIGLSGGGK